MQVVPAGPMDDRCVCATVEKVGVVAMVNAMEVCDAEAMLSLHKGTETRPLMVPHDFLWCNPFRGARGR